MIKNAIRFQKRHLTWLTVTGAGTPKAPLARACAHSTTKSNARGRFRLHAARIGISSICMTNATHDQYSQSFRAGGNDFRAGRDAAFRWDVAIERNRPVSRLFKGDGRTRVTDADAVQARGYVDGWNAARKRARK